MGQILTLISGKGGSGKTVISLAIGRMLSNAGISVLLIDFDLTTHGASYFFEPEIEAAHIPLVTVADLRDTGKIAKKILKTNSGFDFIPSVSDPEFFASSNFMTDEGFLKDVISHIIRLAENYQIVILDCQAGYSSFVKQAVGISDRTILVLEPDAVSSAAIRVLHLQLGRMLRANSTWQIFNKLTEEERPVYEKVMGGTLFSSLPPVPFDWQVRAAFAVREIPAVTSRSSAFGLGVIRLAKIVLPQFKKQLDKLEDKSVGNWYSEISSQMDLLEMKRKDIRYNVISRHRRLKIERLQIVVSVVSFISLGIAAFILYPVPFVEKYVKSLNQQYVVALFMVLSILFSAFVYLMLGIRDVKAEFEQDKAQEELNEIEKEIGKFVTLVRTEPGLREYQEGRQRLASTGIQLKDS